MEIEESPTTKALISAIEAFHLSQEWHQPGLQVTIEQAIAAWLDAKVTGKSGSLHTKRKYEEIITGFREALRQFSLDLDSNPRLVNLAAQGWAGQRFDGETEPVSNATFNQRLAVISSFYDYAKKHDMLTGENPIDYSDRKRVQPYAAAVAMDEAEFKKKLKAIDQKTLAGKRDFALLSVAGSTGRRVSELAGMRWGHIRIEGNKMTLVFPRCKGGKRMTDTLGPQTTKALLGYLHELYGSELGMLAKDAPIWVSLARNKSNGGAISDQAISDICLKWLGTSKVHTTRHTFSVIKIEHGATITELADRLGHENIATTSIYAKQLTSSENKHVEKIELALGIEYQG